MDNTVEELKRLCAFTGLKIVKVVVDDYSIEFVLKLKRKIFRIVCRDNQVILFDNECNEIIRLSPKFNSPNIPNINIPYVQPYSPSISPNTWTTSNNTGAGDVWTLSEDSNIKISPNTK